MEYVKILTSMIEVIEPLNESERGRLFTAMLEYAGGAKQPELKGNERYCWPLIKQAIDRERTRIETLRDNGSKGGRPKNQEEPNETKENQTKPNETKEPNKRKDKDKETKDNIVMDDELHRKELRACAREALTDQYPHSALPEIWVDQLADAAMDLELDKRLLNEAIHQAAKRGAASPVAYAIAVMRDMYEHSDRNRSEYLRRQLQAGYQ